MRTSTRNISIQGRNHASKKQYSTQGLRGDMFGQAGIPRGKENLWNRSRMIQKDRTKGGNSPFCRAFPHSLLEKGTSGKILKDLHALFQGRPDLFLSHEENKVLVGMPKRAETFYTFVHLQNFPRQLCKLCRLQYHYFLAFGYVHRGDASAHKGQDWLCSIRMASGRRLRTVSARI